MNKKDIQTFFLDISFKKPSFILYKQIISGKVLLDKYTLIYMVCQTAHQVGFYGYFDDFYFDIYNRRHVYVKQIRENLKTCFLSKETFMTKLKRKLYCVKITNMEILFNRIIPMLELDKIVTELFVVDDENKKQDFINICNKLFSENTKCKESQKIVPI